MKSSDAIGPELHPLSVVNWYYYDNAVFSNVGLQVNTKDTTPSQCFTFHNTGVCHRQRCHSCTHTWAAVGIMQSSIALSTPRLPMGRTSPFEKSPTLGCQTIRLERTGGDHCFNIMPFLSFQTQTGLIPKHSVYWASSNLGYAAAFGM